MSPPPSTHRIAPTPSSKLAHTSSAGSKAPGGAGDTASVGPARVLNQDESVIVIVSIVGLHVRKVRIEA